MNTYLFWREDTRQQWTFDAADADEAASIAAVLEDQQGVPIDWDVVLDDEEES